MSSKSESTYTIECYGQGKFGHKEDCKRCIAKGFCKDAKNPPLLSHQHVPFESVCQNLNLEKVTDHPASEKGNDRKIYTRNDMLEVICFLISLDTQTLDMLDAKIGNPGISFSDIARKRGVSRQAVHKYIKKKCERIPELSVVLQNYTNKHKKAATAM